MAILLDQVCRHLRCHGCWGVVQCRCFEIVASAKIVSTNGSGDLAASMGEHVWKSDQFFCFFCFERKMSSVGCANKRQKVLLFIEVKEFNLGYNQIFHVTSMSHFQLCIIAKLVEFPFLLQPLISHIFTFTFTPLVIESAWTIQDDTRRSGKCTMGFRLPLE